MIITRTPFRVPIGGGGTDLPSFYKKHGGFIFGATINKYMYIILNRPPLDSLIRVKYFDSETVKELNELKHSRAREALRLMKVYNNIEVTSVADLSAGTGMGSSLSYLVGLLKALHTLNRKEINMQELAEEASYIEMEILKSSSGKQDQYLASFGGFVEMNIDTNGKVQVLKPKIEQDTIEELEYKISFYFTNKHHDSESILSDQHIKIINEQSVERAMLKIKEIGKEIKNEMEKGNLQNFGKLLHEHWQEKKSISSKMSDSELDSIYELAIKNGALGGKIMGSGGGGLFMFFSSGTEEKKQLKSVMLEKGLKEMNFKFDFEGSKVLMNLYQQPQ
jgi:D-glycero-alpha-D-manno-heptose-7-phosphate kinase